jgi:hypothetical protein
LQAARTVSFLVKPTTPGGNVNEPESKIERLAYCGLHACRGILDCHGAGSTPNHVQQCCVRGGPITTYDFTGGAVVGTFIPTGAFDANNGRGVEVIGNLVYYTELSGGGGHGFHPNSAV